MDPLLLLGGKELGTGGDPPAKTGGQCGKERKSREGREGGRRKSVVAEAVQELRERKTKRRNGCLTVLFSLLPPVSNSQWEPLAFSAYHVSFLMAKKLLH